MAKEVELTGPMRFFPGLHVLRHYDRSWFRFDLIAGVTVAAYLVPQCMAYAEIAGLPTVVGLWAILPPMVLYAIFGSSRQLSVGPESTTAIMTAAAVAPLALPGTSEYAALCAGMAVLVGVVCVIGRLARLGFVANLLSRPILVGYLTGVACIMISGQLDKVTGASASGDTFFAEVADFLSNLDQIHGPTLALSAALLVLLFALQHFAPKAPGPLIAVVVSVIVVAVFNLEDKGIALVGEIPAGLPRFTVPDLSLSDVGALLAGAVGIALVGYSDNVLTGRGFAKQSHTHTDPDQELLALGVSNIGGGLFQGFPISSSGSRTVIGASLGSKSQMYSLVGFVSVIAVILFLRPVLEIFPSAALGALVIYAAIKLIDVPEMRNLWRFRRTELALALATTAGVLFTDILIGVAIAIALSILDLLARISRPHDAILGRADGLEGWHDIADWDGATTVPGLVIYRYDAPLFFANAEDFRDSALRSLDWVDDRDEAPVRWFVLQAEAVGRMDSTAADVFAELVREVHELGLVFAVAETKTDLRSQFDRAGLTEVIGADRFYETINEAVAAFHDWEADEAGRPTASDDY